MAWGDAFKTYITVECGFRARSIEAYMDIVNRLLVPRFGEGIGCTPLPDLCAWIQDESRKGKSSSTIAKYCNVLRCVMKFLGRTDYTYVQGPINRRRMFNVPNPTEAVAIIDAADARHPKNYVNPTCGKRDRALAALLYASGLRVSEACQLKVNDIDYAASEVTVRNGKGGKSRVVWVPGAAIPAVLDWLDSRFPGGDAPADAWVFPCATDETRPLNRAHAYVIVRRLGKRAKSRVQLTPHTFRRAYATHTLQDQHRKGNRSALADVSAALGHASFRTTEHYLCYSDEYNKSEYRRCWPGERTARGESAVAPLTPTILLPAR